MRESANHESKMLDLCLKVKCAIGSYYIYPRFIIQSVMSDIDVIVTCVTVSCVGVI